MPPKRESNHNNLSDISTTMSHGPTIPITVSSTSNNGSCDVNNVSSNCYDSNSTVTASLATRSATAAATMSACSSSNPNTNSANNNNNSNNSNNNIFINHNNSTGGGTTMADNGSNPTVYANDVAAEQRTIAHQSNAKLCRLVRKCPWMYDRNHYNYAKKHILDKSWMKIAKECNDSVVSCKERWRNIRAAFARSINIYKTHSGPNRVKPYYLHKELTFLVKPMMEGRDKKDEFEEENQGDLDTKGGFEMDVSGCGGSIKGNRARGGGGVMEDEDGVGDDDDENDVDDDENENENELDQENDEPDDPDDTDDIKSSFEALNPAISIHENEDYSLNNNLHMLHHQDRAYSHNNNNSNSNNINYEKNNLPDYHNVVLPSVSDTEIEFKCSNDDRYTDRQLRSSGSSHLKRPVCMSANQQCDAKRTRLMPTNTLTAQEADVRFLEAILPDMALMNAHQKITFKRKVYQTLEEVLENSANFSSYQQLQSTHPSISNSIYNNNNSNNSNKSISNNHNNSTSYGNHGFQNPTTTTATAPTTVGIGVGVGVGVGVGNQVKQTVLTVNSSMARTLINNIAQLNESDLQKVNGFLQTQLHNQNITGRLTNGTQMASSGTTAHFMHSTPKITITKVTCPPPSLLRNFHTHSLGNNNGSQALNVGASTATVTAATSVSGTHAIVHSTGLINPNVHSTTTVATAVGRNTSFQSTSSNSPSRPTATSSNINTNNNNANANQNGNLCMLPITIKDEMEDIDTE